MNRFNRSNLARCIDTDASYEESSLVLEAVIHTHRDQLVLIARHLLGNLRHDAEDIVQDVCLEVLEGDVHLPANPGRALSRLKRAVRAASRRHLKGGGD